MTHSIKYALRLIVKRPLFSLAVVMMLGVCIGAVTAVLSVVDATLLTPLPFPEPDRLVQLVVQSEKTGETVQDSQNGATWETFKRSAKTVDLAIERGPEGVNFASGNDAAYITQQRVSAAFFRVEGVAPALGREFSPEEDIPGGPPIVVLSNRLWVNAYHSDPNIVGHKAMIAGEPYEIIGVMPASFPSADIDMWTPVRPNRTGEGAGINYDIIGRITQGRSWAEAQAEIRSIGSGLLAGRQNRPGSAVYFGLVRLQDRLTAQIRTALILILCAAGFVLLIGCVNAAGLLLARGASRASEMATRIAIGASRAAVMAQLMVESILLGLLGAAAGIAIGYFGLHAMKSALADGFAGLRMAPLNLRVLGLTTLVSFIASILFGLFPALQARRVDIRSAQTGRGVLGGSRSLLRRALTTVQIAVAVLLLVGAGLLIRTFEGLSALTPGFDSANVISASFSLRDARYRTAEKTNVLFDRVLARMHEISGVETAAVALTLPYERGLNIPFWKPGDNNIRLTNVVFVSPDFFAALRMPLLRGRGIEVSDRPQTAPIVIANAAFARANFPNSDPLAAQIGLGSPTELSQIVGIVGDVQQQAGWGSFGPMAPVPTVYLPAAQGAVGVGFFSPKWIIRTRGPVQNIEQQMQAAVAAVDPLLPLSSFRTLDEIKAKAFAFQRSMALLLSIAAGLALFLAVCGIYAMMANAVAERAREFGIRMALGSTPAEAIRSGARPGVISAAIGTLAGLAVSMWAVRALQSIVWGVRPLDPATFIAVAAIVITVAVLASIVPALRIARVNPADTLRQE